MDSSLFELIKCSNCKEIFQDNCRDLPVCTHSLCTKCLNKATEVEKIGDNLQSLEFAIRVVCPVCGASFKMGQDVEDELPLNETINFIGGLYRLVNENFSKKKQCGECEKREAEFYCKTCKAHLCKECSDLIHTSKMFKKHELIASKLALSAESALFKCPKHPSKTKEYYCKDCDASLCIDCLFLENHKDHVIVELGKIFQGSTGRIKQQLNKTSQTIERIIQFDKHLENLLSEIEINKDQILGDVELNSQEARRYIDSAKQRVMIQTDFLFNEMKSKSELIQTAIQRRINEMTLCQNTAKEVMQFKNNALILNEIEAVITFLQQISDVPEFEDVEPEDFEIESAFADPNEIFRGFGKILGKTGPQHFGGGVIEITGQEEFPEKIVCEQLIIKNGGVLTVKPWDGTSGGTLKIYAKQRVVIEKGGRIDLSGKGYRGGDAVAQSFNGKANQGESYLGYGGDDQVANSGGGGAGLGSSAFGGFGGGGGGYGDQGKDAEANRYSGQLHPGAKGGEIYGDEKISTLYLGSGGGSGHPYSNGQTKGKGGNGGGAIFIQSRSLSNDGEILCNGENGEDAVNSTYGSGGGGGSGGSILIIANLTNNGTISAKGGLGGKAFPSASPGINSSGGAGGDGRIAVFGPAKGISSTPAWKKF
ncbi:bonus isoform c-related [Anaeramoeba ignava]|uniref:Bonus isoform c-related n=1 Tax=Anaeramoeba ignava TaxID=1746090 RepID=A0A9Q0LUM8_ANAIG|nr:bonus isoform c-related [Anaeramoeba ignava]|eukprot:Anaeramoba_ignava/c21421_g3_i1.p2 GENE.c21421_g3_i1~~c21421_g3_i1.p2  ORF type:complete len:657 (-),score=135.24 c21421_g3_i1:3353-5302(-)